MVSRKKDTYWHEIAALCLQAGQPPSKVSQVVKHVFPKTEVNGRHIGAYKRRLIQDEDILIPNKPTMPMNQMTEMAHGMVSTEEAIKDSGLDLEKIDKLRVGVIWGSSKLDFVLHYLCLLHH